MQESTGLPALLRFCEIAEEEGQWPRSARSLPEKVTVGKLDIRLAWDGERSPATAEC